MLIRTQLLDTVSVSSDSMAPTVCSGDTVLLTRLHGADSVRINDIVTFANPQDSGDAIKRVIATAGQQVALRDAVLVVDGQPVDEPYVDHSSIDGVYFGPVVVPGRHGVRHGRPPRSLHRLPNLRPDSHLRTAWSIAVGLGLGLRELTRQCNLELGRTRSR